MGCQLLNQIELLAQKHKRVDLYSRKWPILYLVASALNCESDTNKFTQSLQILYALLKQAEADTAAYQEGTTPEEI